MPFIDDLVASNEIQGETFSAALGKLDFVNREEAQKLFPGVKITDSPNITYFPFKLCHSLPTVNGRGRAFSPLVLQNSFASLNDQLIDWEHYLEANDVGRDDRIIGHVKATVFNLPESVSSATASQNLSLTDRCKKFSEIANALTPAPVLGLGALFNRAKGVADAVTNHMKKKEKWAVSMECGHRWKDAVLLYAGEFIPLPDAELAMRDCIQVDHIKPYKERPLVACLGGLDGSVNFWGLGFTQDPADRDANILNLFAGTSDELASRKFFYMPFYALKGSGSEIESKGVDTIIKDLGSISMIGCTHPAGEDKHSHPILSNLTVVPHNGHGHNLTAVHIKRGSKPTLTGHTNEHTEYTRDYASSSTALTPEVSSGNTHMHTVDIPLLGRFDPPDGQSLDGPAFDYLSSEESNIMKKTLAELMQQINEIASNLSKTAEQAKRDTLFQELATATAEASKEMASQSSEQARKDFVLAEIAAGRIATKEQLDKAVADAVAKTTTELEEQRQKELKAQEVRSTRIQKCTELGIDLDMQFDGIVDDKGQPMTMRKKVELLATDDAGEREFTMQAALMAKAAPKPAATTEQKTPEAQKAEAQLAEAANKKPPVRVLPVVGSPAGGGGGGGGGGAGGAATETASGGKLVGKSRLRATILGK